MQIVHIFDSPNIKLLTIKYDGEELNALEILQEQWTSSEFLWEFFTKFQKDWFKKYGNSNRTKLVQQVIRLAYGFFDKLYEVAEETNPKALIEFFKPLHNRELNQKPYELQPLKAREESRKSFLRIYAIRYKDYVIVTGGAIKLTDRMEDRPHTRSELKKLELVKTFLDINDPNIEFRYLDI